jgi:hypothetical protein
MTEHTPMPKASRLEVITTGPRRRWTEAERLRIVAEISSGHRAVSATARRNGLSTSHPFHWRKQVRNGRLGSTQASFAAAAVVTVRGGHLLLFSERRGGAGVSVVRLGDRSNFQVAGILGDGKRLPSTATAGPAAPAVTAANSRCGPEFLGVGVPMVYCFATFTIDCEAGRAAP